MNGGSVAAIKAPDLIDLGLNALQLGAGINEHVASDGRKHGNPMYRLTGR